LRVKKPQLRVKAYPHSATARYVIEGLRVNGKRKRLFFRTKSDAELELRRLKIKRTREGEDSLSIPDTLRLMARDCAQALLPFNKTLRDATDFYLAHLEAANQSISVNALVDEFLQSRAHARLSETHLIDLRYRLGHFSASFGEAPVRTLAPRAIEHWLHGLELSPTSINNFRARLCTLFNYALKRNYVSTNPFSAVEPIKVVEEAPEIFTPTQLQAVLQAAPPELIPALIIGAFAGLRTAELFRLEWSEVDLGRGFVQVTAAKAKSARRRLIPISPNLAEWLAPYARLTGKVCRASQQEYHANAGAAATAAGLVRWPKNGLRHSFASYHLALHHNAPETSLYLGHTSPTMVFNHYREVVTPEAAARYFAIRPAPRPENVVELKRGRCEKGTAPYQAVDAR
jgi:integrase